MPDLVGRLRDVEPTVRFGAGLFVVLLVVNLLTNGGTFAPGNLPVTLGLAAPVVLAAFAATPAMLVGSGGIDVSIGPVMGLANVVVVHELIVEVGVESPGLLIPAALGTGLAVGLVNGVCITYLRLQPIVATLGTYLICAGLTLYLAPTPGGSVPDWLASLAGTYSFVPIAIAALIWVIVRRLPYYGYLMATGGDERAVYTSGVSTSIVRLGSFALSGLFAGIGGLALSAVLGSADPTVGVAYTLTGIAAAALGGVSLAGGQGGLGRALVGALTIFLLQNLLTYLRVSPFLLQVTYGVVLVLAVAINGRMTVIAPKGARR